MLDKIAFTYCYKSDKIMALKDGILTGCLKQIRDGNTVFSVEINDKNVVFSATRKNKTGKFKLKIERFYELLNSQINTQCVFSSWFGNAFNDLLEQEGSSTKLMC